jgi:4-amino-4-deoxy-L-arabinose transferase-like glycosyltransferase
MTTSSLSLRHPARASRLLWLRENIYGIAAFILFGAALLIRVIHLNYNSAFSDEAIYVVVGKMGIFQLDWLSYSAQSWMAGLPYIYPPLTAITYSIGGILGSRFLNVVIGLFILKEVYTLTRSFIAKKNGTIAHISALIAVYIVAFSAVSLFVTRLATYDALSFFLLMYGLNHLINAQKQADGRFYFIASVALTLAFYTKIVVAAYIPLLVVLSFLSVYGKPAKFKLWHRYFMYPVILGTIAYAFINYGGLFTYTVTQAAREHESFVKIASLIWFDSSYILILGAFGLVVSAFIFKNKLVVLYLAVFASVLPVLHFLTHRYSTLEKHELLMIVFIAPLIGYACAYFVTSKNLIVRFTSLAVLVAVLGYYPFYEYNKLIQIQTTWPDASGVMDVMAAEIHPNDKILTETGPAIILAVYDKTSPVNVTTFDWFEYGTLKGDAAYLQAVQDGYFDYIEIDGKSETIVELIKKLRVLLPDKYTQIYSTKPFEIYERTY